MLIIVCHRLPFSPLLKDTARISANPSRRAYGKNKIQPLLIYSDQKEKDFTANAFTCAIQLGTRILASA
jgi:hypothetical protein